MQIKLQQLDLQGVVADVDAQLLFDSHCFVASSGVLRAISKLKLHKDDGDLGLASDYFVYAGPELSTHVLIILVNTILDNNNNNMQTAILSYTSAVRRRVLASVG